jgi:transposase
LRVLPARDNGQRRTEAGEEAKEQPRADHPQAANGRADALGGKEIGEAAKALEVSEQTLHRWRNQYGGMKAADVKRLKELEKENGQLKRLVADKELENLALKEIAKGNF